MILRFHIQQKSNFYKIMTHLFEIIVHALILLTISNNKLGAKQHS